LRYQGVCSLHDLYICESYYEMKAEGILQKFHCRRLNTSSIPIMKLRRTLPDQCK
jgi:hypothetical protein